MARFLIYFEREQLLSGMVEVEAESRERAVDAFYRGCYDDVRLTTSLALDDSEDAVVEVREA